MKLVVKTISLCPQCLTIQYGTIFTEDGKVKIKIQCPEHGEQFGILSNQQEFYKKIKEIVEPYKIQLEYNFKTEIIKTDLQKNVITTIHINLTDRCNLRCKDCFAACDPEKKQNVNEISLDEILTSLAPYQKLKHKPMIVIIGGEPTLREDLPEIIR